MMYTQSRICPGEWEAKISLWFWDTKQILARWPNLIIIKKENSQNCGLCCPSGSQSKIERKGKEKISTWTLLGKWKKTVEHKSDGDTNCNCYSWYSHQRIDIMTGGLGNKRTSGDHLNYYIIEIGQNTEKSSGGLRRFAVTQTPVKERSSADASVKNSQKSKIIIITALNNA